LRKMNEGGVVLLVDDEPDLLESCERILSDEGFICVTTTKSAGAIELAREHKPEVIVTDFLMPGKNGMDILKEAKSEFGNVPVIMISAYATTRGVVEAVKSGAFDYLTKPFSSDQLVITVRRALEQCRLQRENAVLKKRLQDNFFNNRFVGKHPSFLKAVRLIRKVAASESNVLIKGETGTGKEIAARAIHMHSKRADGPFLVVDCSILSKEMTEASRGGADSHECIFETADGGTVYLEQVEELDPIIQARLIRIIRDRRCPKAGGLQETVPVDVRFIASTTVDLYSAMLKKQFRENLYYCLNVVSVDIPPLRERKEDIGILCDHFFGEMAVEESIQPPSLHPDTLAKLIEYDWPGNVRQLRNVIQRAVSISEEPALNVEYLPEEIRYFTGSADMSYSESRRQWLQQFEKKYLENLLLANRGNISRASEMAGVARMSFYRMLKRTGLQNLVAHERESAKSEAVKRSEEK